MRSLFIVLPLLALPIASQAADSINVNIRGTLHIASVCDVSSAGDVDLGNIITTKIDGSEYLKPLNISLQCNNFNPAQSVGVTLTGTGANGQTNKLPITGNAKGFHLALKRGGNVQNFNTRIPMTSNGSLNLNIVPENITTVPFVAGTFNAAITVKVDVR